MEFVPSNLNIARLKRKMDISGLTLQVDGENVYTRGRFIMLWKNGDFLIIQAEPWWRPGFVPDPTSQSISCYLEEHRALWHVQEVIQTMLDTIVFDGENNWAYLVRLKNKSYRLVYKKRRLIPNCPIWTKVVELDDIELARFASGLCWEGIYQGKDVDVFIGWQDEWGEYISAESRGQMLVQSMGLGRYFFDLIAHVSKNGVIVGIMMEALVGRSVTLADRSAVFEAVADIQRHGVLFFFQISDIYITEQGVRFASASTTKHYRDGDALAEQAKSTWEASADMFDHMDVNPLSGILNGSRLVDSTAFIIPRLPSLGRPMALTPEDAIIRWIWSITTSDDFCRSPNSAFDKLKALYGLSVHSLIRRDKRSEGDSRTLLPPDDFSDTPETSVARIEAVDKPLTASRGQYARWCPYARLTPKRLLLPREPDAEAPN